MPVRRVLITNSWLRTRAGTEQYVRDLALALQARGHQPTVFSPLLGEVSDELAAAGIPVTDDLASLADAPDLVHGQMHHETVAALSRFPDRPGLYVQHAAEAWQDEPPLHPRLLRYVAVDQRCLERLAAAGVPPERTLIVGNGVDTARFRPRDPLPPRPRRALVLSNYAGEDDLLPMARAACEPRGIELDVVGAAAGTPSSHPEELLAGYDVVLGKARVVMEALAVGCAAVVADAQGIGGMVSHADLVEWRRWNFGRALMTRPFDAATLGAELDRYDPDDVVRCRDHVRSEWSLDLMVDALLEAYDDVLADWDPAAADPRAELTALAGPLSLLGPLRTELEHARPYVDQTPGLVEAWQHEAEQARLLRQHVVALEAARDGAP